MLLTHASSTVKYFTWLWLLPHKFSFVYKPPFQTTSNGAIDCKMISVCGSKAYMFWTDVGVSQAKLVGWFEKAWADIPHVVSQHTYICSSCCVSSRYLWCFYLLYVIVRLTEIMYVLGTPRCTFIIQFSWADAPPSVLKMSFHVSEQHDMISVGEAIYFGRLKLHRKVVHTT